MRSIDIAPTIAYLMRILEPQHSQGRVLLEVLQGSNSVKPLTIIGLNDFHGQLDPTTMLMDGANVSVGGAAFLATLFDEEASEPAGRSSAARRRRQRRRIAAELGLLEDMPAIDVENAWAWTPPPTATMSSTTASSACCVTRSGPTSRSSRQTSSRRRPGSRPTG